MYQLQLPVQDPSTGAEDQAEPRLDGSYDSEFFENATDLSAARERLRRILEEDGSDVVVEIPAARVLDLVEECAFWKSRTHEMGEIAKRLEKILDRNLEMRKR